jgi:hypothetical protein
LHQRLPTPETKGHGFDNFIKSGTDQFYDWFTKPLEQSQRQITAAGGTPITWYFAESDAANAMQTLLGEKGLTQIQVIFQP